MTHRRPQFLFRYGVAVFSVMVAVGVRRLLDPLLGDAFPFATILFAILVTAWLRGFGPAVAAVVLGGLAADYFLLPPRGSFDPGGMVGWIGMVLYAGTGFGIALLGGLMQIEMQRVEGGALNTSEKMGPVDAALFRKNFATELKIQAGFIFTLLCLAATGFIAWTSQIHSSEQAEWSRHTQKVIADLRQLLSTVTEAETAQRGYIITGDKNFLKSFGEARERVAPELSDLRQLTKDNAGQQHQLDLLEPAVAARLEQATVSIDQRRNQGFAKAQAEVASGRGTVMQERLRTIVAEMEATENSLLEQRHRVAQHDAFIARLFIAGSCVLAFGVAALALFAIRQDFARTQLAEAALLAANDQLESHVRKRTASLAASEARMAGIVGSAMDAIISVDEQQKIVLFNLAAEKLFRCSAAATLGQPLDRFIPQHFRAEHWQQVTDFGKSGVTSSSMRLLGALSALRADGEEFPIEASISKIEVAGEKIYTVILRDITERMQAEKASRLLTAMVDSSFDAIIGKDLKSRVTSWNSGAEKMFGYAASEMMGRSITLLFPPDRLDDEEKIMSQIMRGESLQHYETVRVKKDGELIDVSVTVSPIKDASGAIIGASKVARDISERKRVAAALHESDERTRLATEATGVGIWEWNVRTNKIRWDAQMFRIYGQPPTPDGFIDYGLWAGAVLPAELREQEAILQDTVRRRGRSNREFRIQRANDKECRHLQAVETVRTNVNGQAEWVVGTNLDITERKRAELALRESEERFSRMFNSSPVATSLSTGRDGRYLDVNNAFLKIFQWTRDEVIGRTVFELNTWIDLRQRAALFAELQEHGGVQDFEIELRAKSGQAIQILWSGVQLVIGGETCLLGSALDITQRKRAEAALQESEARFRTMANSIPQLAWIGRADGYIFWYNQRWYEYTGTTPEQMEGWGWQKVHHPETLPRVMAGWQHAIETGAPFEMEFPLCGADGTFRTFLTRVQPLKDSAGHVVQWFGTNTDVDALKLAEENIRRLNATLEQRVIERTAQLEAANKELEAFSYSVSHDLRAPLRAVNGFAGIVLDEFGPQLNGEGRRYLERIRLGGQRMGELIDDLLAFSRLSRQPMNRQKINSSKLVKSVLAETLPPAAERPITVNVGHLPACLGDPALLQQVWVNLISNAVKYTRGRAPAVIEIGCDEVNDERVFFVRDNGTGFDMKYAHKLFAVFQRLHRADEFEGTGVGLAIVHRIIHRHGGRIWTAAAEGRGATFYFTLEENTKHERTERN
jgi:PAS domain S-box-containing protein